MNNRLNRTLTLLIVSLFIVSLIGCTSHSAQKREDIVKPIELKVSSLWPGSHPQNTEVITQFLSEVEQLTGGRVTGTVYPLDALGEADAQFDLALTGVADMSTMLHGSTPGQFPLTSVSELPLMGESAVDGTRILWELYERFPEIDKEHAGTKVAWLFKNDPAQILTTNKPVHKWEDLKGLRIRTPSPAGSALLEAYGAIPVSLTMGEVYEAMQRGIVDGALAPASVINNFQLGDVTNYITKGNFYTSSILVVMNEKTWNKFSEQEQREMEKLMGERMALIAAEMYDEDAASGWETVEEKGIEVYELSEQEIADWMKPLEVLYDDWVEKMDAKGLPGSEVFEVAVELRDKKE